MYYTQEQIDRANQADLVSFLQSQGEPLERAGQEYRWKRHDSLTVRGNKWYRHSQSKGGAPIDFVMEFFGKSFTEAVELLTGEKGEAPPPGRPSPASFSDFRLPPPNSDNILTGIVIIGGISAIASVCEKLVPFMAIFYVLGCFIILGINYDFIGPAVSAILSLAFKPGAVAGGLVGQGLMVAMRFGVARGLFSNESGLGSAPLVASAAQTRNPVRQALVSATGTFWDTVVVCLMTGLVLVSTIMKNPDINMDTIADGGQLTTLAFSQIPVLGPVILVVGIITFAWSTILGWSYYGERCAQYLWGKKAILPYKIIFVAVVVVGPVLALDLVWTIADILNAFMAVPNLIAVLLLSGTIAKDTKHYLRNLDEVDKTEIPMVNK